PEKPLILLQNAGVCVQHELQGISTRPGSRGQIGEITTATKVLPNTCVSPGAFAHGGDSYRLFPFNSGLASCPPEFSSTEFFDCFDKLAGDGNTS
ncbi:hypothetical protein BG006_006179, partial [Podila minutissima]